MNWISRKRLPWWYGWGSPPRSRDLPVWIGAALLVLLLGGLFPMAGVGTLVILPLDVTLLRALPGLRRALI
jgi:uncharacterized iron-regulated membrane protein